MNRLAYWKKYITQRQQQAECRCTCDICRRQHEQEDQARMIKVIENWGKK